MSSLPLSVTSRTRVSMAQANPDRLLVWPYCRGQICPIGCGDGVRRSPVGNRLRDDGRACLTDGLGRTGPVAPYSSAGLGREASALSSSFTLPRAFPL
jgi:hypothetical protein